jgi:hypothetical protein
VGETIAFSVCNKHFKPLGLPSGRVKSREGLPGMIPTNILKHYVVEKQESTQTHGSDIMSKFNKLNNTHIIKTSKIIQLIVGKSRQLVLK